MKMIPNSQLRKHEQRVQMNMAICETEDNQIIGVNKDGCIKWDIQPHVHHNLRVKQMGGCISTAFACRCTEFATYTFVSRSGHSWKRCTILCSDHFDEKKGENKPSRIKKIEKS